MSFRAKWLCVVIVAVSAATACADTLGLRNGDRVSGTILSASDQSLVLRTEYVGDLEIQFADILTIVSETPVTVHMQDGAIGAVEVHTAAETPPATSTPDAATSPAPTDAATKETEPARKKWSGTADAGASWRSGDTDTVDANLGVSVIREWERDKLTLKLGAGYSETDSEVNTRMVQGSARWQHYISERTYSYVRTGAEHDPGRRLDLRTEIGAGMGRDFVKNDRRTFSADIGLDYVHERWNKYSIVELDDAEEAERAAQLAALTDLRAYLASQQDVPWAEWTPRMLYGGFIHLVDVFPQDGGQETYTEDHVNLRLSAAYEQRLFKDSLFSEKLTWMPELDDPGQYRLLSDLAFSTPLSDKLDLRLNVLTEYDSDRGQDDAQLNNTFLMALRYKF